MPALTSSMRGGRILDEVILASSSYASAESGWTALLEGDAKARDAAQLVKGDVG